MGAVVAGLFGILFGTHAAGAWIGIALMTTAIGLTWMVASLPVDRLLSQYMYNI